MKRCAHAIVVELLTCGDEVFAFQCARCLYVDPVRRCARCNVITNAGPTATTHADYCEPMGWGTDADQERPEPDRLSRLPGRRRGDRPPREVPMPRHHQMQTLQRPRQAAAAER
jgi:hypothetical protein